MPSSTTRVHIGRHVRFWTGRKVGLDYLRKRVHCALIVDRLFFGRHLPYKDGDLIGGTVMNKTELIDALSGPLGDRKVATAALDAVLAEIQNTVTKGDKVSITGFGVFEKRVRAARTARNPRTGEAVKVKKTSVPTFRPGATFKELVAAGKPPKATTTAPQAKRAATTPAKSVAAPARKTATASAKASTTPAKATRTTKATAVRPPAAPAKTRTRAAAATKARGTATVPAAAKRTQARPAAR
jgi:DNA-binding protein HU-beta